MCEPDRLIQTYSWVKGNACSELSSLEKFALRDLLACADAHLAIMCPPSIHQPLLGSVAVTTHVCRSYGHYFACHSLYFPSLRGWQLFFHLPIASTKTVLLAGAASAQDLFNILEPPIKADPSSRLFSCNGLDVSNTLWEGSCFHIHWIPCQCEFVGLACTTVFLLICAEGVRWIDSVPS